MTVICAIAVLHRVLFRFRAAQLSSAYFLLSFFCFLQLCRIPFFLQWPSFELFLGKVHFGQPFRQLQQWNCCSKQYTMINKCSAGHSRTRAGLPRFRRADAVRLA